MDRLFTTHWSINSQPSILILYHHPFFQLTIHCMFCKGNHFNDMYNSFSSLGKRKQSLSQQGRCFKDWSHDEGMPATYEILLLLWLSENTITDACVFRD